ncbi:transglycosylase domain-containing protein, partial [Hyella patelloides]|uniref:transglycosylase domain-containing protein n=1 Tax=Hyella patelloides TaxID=1982969 RepID=UPI001643AF93
MKFTKNSHSQSSHDEVLPPSTRKIKIRKRHRKRNSKLGLILGLLLGFGGTTIVVIGFWQRLEASVPDSVADVSSYARPNTLTIKAADGSILKEIGEVSHEKIDLAEVPPILHQAFVASEDSRFYQHKGIDLIGISRAAIANVKAQGVKEGGSTITQQLARMAYLNQDRRIGRKLKEMKIASAIEVNLSKVDILETYLNLVYLGAGSYGVADAAWVYFAKTPQELTLSEAATLAGVVPAPSVYSPFSNPEIAKRRRNTVLDRMLAAGYITLNEATIAKNEPLTTNRKHPKRLERKWQYFTNYIEKELPKYVDRETLAEGGIVVETSLDPLWQTAAKTTVSYGLQKYGEWQKFQEAAIVALDPKTGAIKAMIGGKDFGDNQYNRVTQAQRQPGSTFKTFVYAAAMASGFSPEKTYLDAEFFVDGYQPKNNKERYRGTNVSLYDAFVSSINTVALQTIIDVGG